ncbi:MarR family winged helix-turn-helix transcriptional regulator [Brevibacillus ginsengisoli]|uniref:MarR family winged helix-turn-helix transcriptional regulator n=1 Tax=Brevibacillus ginsengisoli TaxID=363854 RepID=UPI003CF52B6A
MKNPIDNQNQTELEGQIKRFETGFMTTFRKIGPELTEKADTKLTGQQFFVLYFLFNKGVCKVTDLAEKMKVKPSASTVMIDRLVKNDYVHRRHDDKDRRVVLISLTQKGEQALQEMLVLRRQVIGRYLSEIDPMKLDIFLDVLEQIAAKKLE